MLLILTGHQRSGTTLLARLCNSHPEICVTHEFGNFRTLGVPHRLYTLGIVGRWLARRQPIFHEFQEKNRFRLKWESHWKVAQYLRALGQFRDRMIDTEQIELCLRRVESEPKILGDKFPDYALNLGQFVQRENLLCVVICRDCRDVCTSFLEQIDREKWPILHRFDSVKKVAHRWAKSIRETLKFRDHLHLIKYEDLVVRPQDVMTGIAQELGVEASAFSTELCSAASVGRYGQSLSDEQQESILRIAGREMRALEYLN